MCRHTRLQNSCCRVFGSKEVEVDLRFVRMLHGRFGRFCHFRWWKLRLGLVDHLMSYDSPCHVSISPQDGSLSVVMPS